MGVTRGVSEEKDRTLRFCVDYRRLDRITKWYVYPLSRIENALNRLHNMKYFSLMYFKIGYWQIEVDEED